MANNNIILTPAGLQKLKDELSELKDVKRKEVAEKIKDAKEQGDLSENAEYAAAKEEQGLIEARIAELEHTVKTAEVADTSKTDDGVNMGSTVVLDSADGESEFEIVGTNEADPVSGKISNESPLGRALMGKNVGDTIEYPTPDGPQSCKIKSIR